VIIFARALAALFLVLAVFLLLTGRPSGVKSPRAVHAWSGMLRGLAVADLSLGSAEVAWLDDGLVEIVTAAASLFVLLAFGRWMNDARREHRSDG
jgi:hypothetical protein